MTDYSLDSKCHITLELYKYNTELRKTAIKAKMS